MNKNIEILGLFDLYGAMLTDRQREVVSAYYECDLSLGEIAENLNISRQGVRDTLTKAQAALKNYEEKLKSYYVKNQLLKAQDTKSEKERLSIIKELIKIL